jgi:4-amino-4-deoxy-L-arabinose transferase-like glycosyltransferase
MTTGIRRLVRSRRLSWESAGATAIIVLAAWLRLRQPGLAGFGDDQAIALRIAHDILHGDIRTIGLTSSSGAANPPLYVYIVAVVVRIHDGVLFADASVVVLSLVAIALAYVVVRRRFGVAVALITTALFATAPWAVFYGRYLWQQNYLPLATVALLWSLFVVLERDRTRVALLVPVLFVIAISLNLSAVALILPIGALIAYRARDVNWRAVIAGMGVGIVLLGSWLAHNAKHGFRDFSLILNNGRGHGGTAGTGTIEAVRWTLDLVSAEGWSFLTGAHHQNGAAWTLGRVAGVVVIVLLVVGIATSLARIVRDGRHPKIDTARRALLLIWLAGICLAYITSSRSGVGPHYLIVSYPVSFLLAALGLSDATSLTRRRSSVISLGAAAAIAAAFVAFTLSFQTFVRQHHGTVGTYGVVYDDTAALAAAVHARNLHIAYASAEYLVWGHLNVPSGTKRFVTVRVRLRDHAPLPCSGQRRWFGPIEACFPR